MPKYRVTVTESLKNSAIAVVEAADWDAAKIAAKDQVLANDHWTDEGADYSFGGMIIEPANDG